MDTPNTKYKVSSTILGLFQDRIHWHHILSTQEEMSDWLNYKLAHFLIRKAMDMSSSSKVAANALDNAAILFLHF